MKAPEAEAHSCSSCFVGAAARSAASVSRRSMKVDVELDGIERGGLAIGDDRLAEQAAQLAEAPAERALGIVGDFPEQMAEPVAADRLCLRRRDSRAGRESCARREAGNGFPSAITAIGPSRRSCIAKPAAYRGNAPRRLEGVDSNAFSNGCSNHRRSIGRRRTELAVRSKREQDHVHSVEQPETGWPARSARWRLPACRSAPPSSR